MTERLKRKDIYRKGTARPPARVLKNKGGGGILENRGGPAEIRTLDPQLARLVLYQLSYRPTIASLTGQHSMDTARQSPSLRPQLFGVFG